MRRAHISVAHVWTAASTFGRPRSARRWGVASITPRRCRRSRCGVAILDGDSNSGYSTSGPRRVNADRTHLMELRRSWSGLEVALLATRAGVTRTLPSRDHQLVCHVGRPVHATCRTDNRTHHRLQSRGDLDLIPAGIPGVWEDDESSTALLIGISPELLAAAA